MTHTKSGQAMDKQNITNVRCINKQAKQFTGPNDIVSEKYQGRHVRKMMGWNGNRHRLITSQYTKYNNKEILQTWNERIKIRDGCGFRMAADLK